jgi:diguanylate cyclase (GGDEF)-like protein
MVYEFEPTAVAPASPSASGGGRGGESSRRRTFSGQPIKRTVVDVSSVLGMVDGGIPLPVQASIAGLVEEVERLRHEVDLAHHYEYFLGEEADRHPILPVLNRRAVLRALGQLLAASERAGVPGSLVYLHFGGIERLREIHGLAAADGALIHVTSLIRAELRQTDLIGYLDGSDFAVALAVAEADGADEKAQHIAARVAERPFVWEGSRFLFSVGIGVAHFQPAISAEDLLAAADAKRRGITDPGTPAAGPEA